MKTQRECSKTGRLTALAVVATLVATAVALGATGAPAGAAVGPNPGPERLVRRTCDLKVRSPATCYWLMVPERRGVFGSRELKLWVAVITPKGTPSTAIPYLRLTGGPGDPGSSAFVNGDVSPVGKPRPLVVIDQRGTGRSTPRPSCPVLDTTTDPRRPWPDQLVILKDEARSCARKLRLDGFDLDGYTTVESAADIVALRRLLGYTQWDVYGLSYGGRLAPEVYRQDPAAVRRMHLDSPILSSPLGVASLVSRANAALARVAAACDRVASCRANGPLLANVDKAYARLEAKPFIASISDGRKVVINGRVLLSGAFQLLYRSELIPLLPVAAKAIAGGDYSILTPLAEQLVQPTEGPDASNSAIFALVSCGDDGLPSPADQKVIADPGRWSSIATDPRSACAEWGLAGVPGGHLARPSGDVPVLLTEGQFDPIAPITYFGGTIKREFPNITVAYVRAAGHVVAFENDCLASITIAFVDGASPKPDTGCVRKLKPAFSG